VDVGLRGAGSDGHLGFQEVLCELVCRFFSFQFFIIE
jgi:hypothetical protein